MMEGCEAARACGIGAQGNRPRSIKGVGVAGRGRAA